MKFRIEKRESFQIIGLSGYESMECSSGDSLTPLWRKFMDEYNPRLWNSGSDSYYKEPFWQVAAYAFGTSDEKIKTIIGAEYKGQDIKDMDIETIPAAAWAVFSITSLPGIDYVPAAYTQIMTEWFPASQYQRDESIPNLEVFPEGDANAKNYTWEIWIPVKSKS